MAEDDQQSVWFNLDSSLSSPPVLTSTENDFRNSILGDNFSRRGNDFLVKNERRASCEIQSRKKQFTSHVEANEKVSHPTDWLTSTGVTRTVNAKGFIGKSIKSFNGLSKRKKEEKFSHSKWLLAGREVNPAHAEK